MSIRVGSRQWRAVERSGLGDDHGAYSPSLRESGSPRDCPDELTDPSSAAAIWNRLKLGTRTNTPLGLFEIASCIPEAAVAVRTMELRSGTAGQPGSSPPARSGGDLGSLCLAACSPRASGADSSEMQ
jgi:hypothetical protein